MRVLFPTLALAAAVAAGDLAQLQAELASEHGLTRYAAARKLGALGGDAKDALSLLVETLKDPEPYVRLEAARAIVRIGARPQDVPALIGRLEFGGADLAPLVGEALAGLGPAAVSALIAKLEADESKVRLHAIGALALCGRHAAEAVPHLIDRVGDDDPGVRQAAGAALRRCGPWAVDYVADIADRLEFGDSQPRWVAATVLAAIGPAAKEAVPALQRLLEGEDRRLQQVAAHALKAIDIQPPRERHPALRKPELATETAPETFRVRFETTRGPFLVEFSRAWSPHGADRIYNLARIGFFDDTAFYRVVERFVVQFGLNGDSRVNTVWKDQRFKDDPVKTSNTKGTVTFAKLGPDSRSTQIFVNLDDNSGLDKDGFAPVGRVVEGMAVVESLHAGYGDGPPHGQGPDQRGIVSMGNEYLKRQFPQLDWIRRAVIVEDE